MKRFLIFVIIGCALPALGQGADNLYCPSLNGPPTWGLTDGPAMLPTQCWNTSIANNPSPSGFYQHGGGAYVAASASDLTNILAGTGGFGQIACGQTLQLRMGIAFSGNFTFPNLGCDSGHWITVATSGIASLPPEGTRVTPCWAGISSLPGRAAYACPAVPGNYMAKIITPNTTSPITLAAGANYYRLTGIEVTRAIGTGYVAVLIALSNGVTGFVFDRSIGHGVETGSTNVDETETLFSNNLSSYVAALDFFAYDFYCVSVAGSCVDSHVFTGGFNSTSSTPDNIFKIVNGFIEAAGENVIWGGGPGIGVPQNFEIRLNNFFKPRQWNPLDPSYDGGANGHPVVVKNLFELKNATLMLVEGNVFQNTWGGFSQNGEVFGIGAKAGGTPVCTVCKVTEITVRYNTANSSNVFIETGLQPTTGVPPSMPYGTYDLSYHDLVGDNGGYPTCYGGGSSPCPFQSGSFGITESPTQTNLAGNPPLRNILFNHITWVDSASAPLKLMAFEMGGELISSGLAISNVTFTNSVFAAEQYGVYNAGGSTGNCAFSGFGNPSAMIPGCWSPYTFGGNCILSNGSLVWPGTNVTSLTPATAFTNYNTGNGGNYVLAAGACKGAATDGTDPGANIAILNSVLAGNPAPIQSQSTGTTIFGGVILSGVLL